jgi:hypothetical protein
MVVMGHDAMRCLDLGQRTTEMENVVRTLPVCLDGGRQYRSLEEQSLRTCTRYRYRRSVL